MDFMLEEELIDLMTFCLQNPDSGEVSEKKTRITEIGKEVFDDGGVDVPQDTDGITRYPSVDGAPIPADDVAKLRGEDPPEDDKEK